MRIRIAIATYLCARKRALNLDDLSNYCFYVSRSRFGPFFQVT